MNVSLVIIKIMSDGSYVQRVLKFDTQDEAERHAASIPWMSNQHVYMVTPTEVLQREYERRSKVVTHG